MIEAHEREGGIDARIHYLQVQAIPFGNGLPVGHAGAPHGIHADPQTGCGDAFHLNDVGQRIHVRRHIIPFLHVARPHRVRHRPASHTPEVGGQQFVGAILDRARDVGIGGSTGGRVVLESPVLGRIMRRRDDDAVRPARIPLFRNAGAARRIVTGKTPIVPQDREGNDRRRRIPPTRRDAGMHPVRSQHLEGRSVCRFGQRVGIHSQVERPMDPVCRSPLADRLRHREDVRFVEGALERRTPMARRAEGHALRGIRGVGAYREIGRNEPGNVDELVEWGRRAGERMNRHGNLIGSSVPTRMGA